MLAILLTPDVIFVELPTAQGTAHSRERPLQSAQYAIPNKFSQYLQPLGSSSYVTHLGVIVKILRSGFEFDGFALEEDLQCSQ